MQHMYIQPISMDKVIKKIEDSNTFYYTINILLKLLSCKFKVKDEILNANDSKKIIYLNTEYKNKKKFCYLPNVLKLIITYNDKNNNNYYFYLPSSLKILQLMSSVKNNEITLGNFPNKLCHISFTNQFIKNIRTKNNFKSFDIKYADYSEKYTGSICKFNVDKMIIEGAHDYDYDDFNLIKKAKINNLIIKCERLKKFTNKYNVLPENINKLELQLNLIFYQLIIFSKILT